MIEYQTSELVRGSETYLRVATFLRHQSQANPEESAIADPGQLEWCEAAVIASEEGEVVGVALLADPGMPHPKKPSVDVVYVAKDYRNRAEHRVGSKLFELAGRYLIGRFPELQIYCRATHPVMRRIIDQSPTDLGCRVDVIDDQN